MAVAKMGMAINRTWTQNNEKKESTCFVDMTAFGRQAEVLAQYVGKGSPLFVEGRLEFSSWEDKEGNKRNKLEVVVENFQFLGGGRSEGGGEGGGGGGRRSASRQEQGAGEENYGDIPF
jgi:single-strand DNA-binding protein